jgi:DNA-binding PadR family transcriptional regulator
MNMSEKNEIAVSKTLTPEEQAVWDAKAKVRALLNLWDLTGGKIPVKKGDLTKRIVRTNETSQRYVGVLDELEKAGAIEYSVVNRVKRVELSAKGKEVLAQGLKSADSLFEFDGSQIGTRLGNALLRWIRHQDGAAGVAAETGKKDGGTIASYNDFKAVAIDVYDRLNRDYNFDDLVPIYRMRQEIGEKVSRSQFNEWLLEMQANDIFQLIGGEMTDITPDKAEDSIKTKLGGIRYYAKRLSSDN